MEASYTVGVDWAQDEHAVCVLDKGGGVVTRFAANHSDAGLLALRKRLQRVAPAGELPVAIERPSAACRWSGCSGDRARMIQCGAALVDCWSMR